MVRMQKVGANPRCKAAAYMIMLALIIAAAASPNLSFAQGIGPRASDASGVTWKTLGTSENDSMPIGNGDLAANVWTEQNGDLVLLVAKSDAWSELGKLDKLARIRVHLSDNPFLGAKNFSQSLDIHTASVEIRSGADRLKVWVDATRPVLHVVGNFVRPVSIEAHLELWRNRTHSYNEPSPDRGGLFGLQGNSGPVPSLAMEWAADTVLPATGGRLTWYHGNSSSLFPLVLRQQKLEQLQSKYNDPLLDRIFGAVLQGRNLASSGDRILRSSRPQKDLQLDLVALTTTAPDTAQAWQQKIAALSRSTMSTPLQSARQQHVAWWNGFWSRSWVRVGGSEEAEKVAQGYAMQRYMMATSSRGAFPAKFNGGLFTVGRDIPDNVDSTEAAHSPDYRKWGSSYWNQNGRHLYWPLLASGDFDLIKPWFDLYVNALPLVKDRTKAYYGHDGAAFVETIDFWGLPNPNDYGWNHDGVQLSSPWMRYHIQGGLEVVAQMLEQYDMTQDAAFAQKTLLPFATEILRFYSQHWPLNEYGKLRIYPSQSIETYQLDATDPAPDIAGILSVTHRLLALPDGLIPMEQRQEWQKLLQKLPPLPTGRTHDGKIPPHGQGDPDGMEVLLPAKDYGDTKNTENPELYAVFPYRLYGVGKPDLKLARDTFAARLFPLDYCWGQDGEEAALLGLTEEARKAAVREFTNYGGQRFRWFWASENDWIPDLDNGGAGMVTLQSMLMQTDGRRIQLLSAWPKNWTADFKLHAPYQTTVEGHVENGKITRLKVSPSSRKQDVVVLGGAS
jgi:alpha-L-fucosidase 2